LIRTEPEASAPETTGNCRKLFSFEISKINPIKNKKVKKKEEEKNRFLLQSFSLDFWISYVSIGFILKMN